MEESERTAHKIEEVRTTDYEKIVIGLQPIIEPTVKAWKEAETEAIKAAERAATWRGVMGTVAMCAVVFAVCALAYACIINQQAPIAEKIVIGLLAFVGGYGANRGR